MAELNLIGGSPTENLASRQADVDLAEETSFGETLGAAWDMNLGPQIWKTLSAKVNNEAEEGFSPQMWIEENGHLVPPEYHGRFSGTRSRGEAHELMLRLNDDLQNQKIIQAKGGTGLAAVLMAGMVDIDMPIAVATGGISKGATIAGRFGKGAKSGAVTGAAIEAGHLAVDPLAETSDIINGALFGTAFGGVGGALLGKRARATADEFNAAKPQLAQETPDAWPEFVDSEQSLGAQYRGNDVVDTSEMSPDQLAEYNRARDTMRKTAGAEGESVSDLLETTAAEDGKVGKMGSKFTDAITKIPGLRSLFDDVASGGTIMKAMAFDLLESPAGRVRNNRSAAALQDRYERLLGTELLPIENAYQAWRKNRAAGAWSDMNGASRAEYDKAVLQEMDKRFQKRTDLTEDPLVKQAADALDAHYKTDLEIKKGRDGEKAVDGSDGLNPKSGHYTRAWDGNAIRKVMRSGVERTRIEALLERAYHTANPHIDVEHAQIVAKAIVRRALAKEDGIDSNLLMTMNADGQEYLRQVLKDSGYADENFDSLLKALKGKSEEAGMLGSNKGKIELDMTMSDGDLSLYDLINTNITELTQRNIRKTAGAAALARKGITNKGQRKTMIDAAIAEMISRGDTNTVKHRETLENMFTYFDGAAIAGGIHPVIARVKRITNLGLLNQMGMTQLGETGAQIQAVGVQTWKRHAKDVFKTMDEEGPHSRLAKELEVFHGRLGEDHLLFRPELQLDDLRQGAAAGASDTFASNVMKGWGMDLDGFLNSLDGALGKGQRLQGYISGFYYVKSMQQKIAVTSMADKVFQRLRDGVDARLLHDIGIDPAQFSRYLDDAEFTPEGYLDRLNMERWDVKDADDFATALNRYSHQVVQKGLTGEDSQWWHQSWGAIFSHLKTFPLMAMQKQAARNMNMGAPVMTAQVAMGLATASMAYTAKQVINAKGVPEYSEMALGGFGMSNMTGWFPMMADPIAAMLGMNDLRFNQYGRHSASTGIIGTPAAIPTLNRMLHIPGAVNPVSQMSRNDRIRALQAAPLVGNAFGFTAIWNSMKTKN
mgnify:CR=1 FL=1